MPTTPSCATSRPGLYFDPAKMHVLDHKGKYLSVRGPLNIARPVQGWPVIVQAGASDDGRQLAAETAEVVFTGGGSLGDGQKLYADIKGRMDKLGRDREHLKILPGAFVVVGDSVDEGPREARAARQPGALRQRHRLAVGDPWHRRVRLRSRWPVARHPRDQRHKSGRQRLVDVAARDKLTVRQLAQRVGGYGGLAFVGTPAVIADQMEEWLTSEGCDGFNIMFPFCPPASTTSSTRWCRNCNGAASSAPSTRAGRCAKISACRGRKTASLRVDRRNCAGFYCQNLDFGRIGARLRANAGRFRRRPISHYLRS